MPFYILTLSQKRTKIEAKASFFRVRQLNVYFFVVLPYVNTSYHMLWQFTLILPNYHIIMRKITQDAYWAFRTEKPFKRGNTQVKVSPTAEGNTTELYLHGNLIARKHPKTGVEITNAGYFTNTTKERLNSLPNVNIHQKNFEWYLNGELWSGEWVRVWRYRYV